MTWIQIPMGFENKNNNTKFIKRCNSVKQQRSSVCLMDCSQLLSF